MMKELERILETAYYMGRERTHTPSQARALVKDINLPNKNEIIKILVELPLIIPVADKNLIELTLRVSFR